MNLSWHGIRSRDLNWIIICPEIRLQIYLDRLSLWRYLWILSVEPGEVLLEVIPRSAVDKSHPHRPSVAVHHCWSIGLSRQKTKEKEMSSENENGIKRGQTDEGLLCLLPA